MARIPSVTRTLSSTIPFARGVADRAVSTAGPIIGGVVGRLAQRLPRRSRTEPSHPQTFAPSPVVEVSDAGVAAEPGADLGPAAPSPAMVARNATGPRPTAKPPVRSKPRSAPGAKLPVTRPST